MAKDDDIQERFIAFAVNIIHLTSQLPKTPARRAPLPFLIYNLSFFIYNFLYFQPRHNK